MGITKEMMNFKNNASKYWEEIGFHKPIAGFWFRFIFIILEIILYVSIAAPLL